MPSTPPTFLPFGSVSTSIVSNTKLVLSTIAGLVGRSENRRRLSRHYKTRKQAGLDGLHVSTSTPSNPVNNNGSANNSVDENINNKDNISLTNGVHSLSIHTSSSMLGMVDTLDLAISPSSSSSSSNNKSNYHPFDNSSSSTIANTTRINENGIIELVDRIASSVRAFIKNKTNPLILCVGTNAITYSHLLADSFKPLNLPIHELVSGEEVSSYLYIGGIVWCSDPSALVEVDEGLFDICICFNLAFSSTDSASRLITLLHRTLRVGGAFAGTGIFINENEDGGIAVGGDGETENDGDDDDLEHLNEHRVADIQWNMRQLRDILHSAQMDVHTAIDMSLEGNVYYKSSPLYHSHSQNQADTNNNAQQSLVENSKFNRLPYGASWCGGRFLSIKRSSRRKRTSLSRGKDMQSLSLSRAFNMNMVECDNVSKQIFESVEETLSPFSPMTASPSLSPSTSMESLNEVVARASTSSPIPPTPSQPTISVTGISLGLPSISPDSKHSLFDSDNFNRLLNGECLIRSTTDEDKQSIIDMNSCQMVKQGEKRVKKFFTDPESVLQVIAKVNAFDLVSEYGVPQHIADTLDVTYKMAIAAGIEALKDANINIYDVNEKGERYIKGLPEEMRDDTGVIFASSFPCLDSCVEEVTKKVTAQVHRELKQEQSSSSSSVPTSEYEYDRKLLFKLLVMANCQLAELIKARGPNTHVNGACAGTSQALSVACDWLSLNRCSRVIVIAADNVTSDNLLPYIATGFLGLGAATTAKNPHSAAKPFDKNRSGMIVGAGAVGIVLERENVNALRESLSSVPSSLPSTAPTSRSVSIVASHVSNSASHACLMDKAHIASQLSVFLNTLESDHNLNRSELARDLIYIAHETGTQACAMSECMALENAFGSSWSDILISNSKGYTGHPMGVSFEDVLAVWTLKTGLVLAVPEFEGPRVNDPKLNLSANQLVNREMMKHNRKYVLRFAAGFGSQLVYMLFKLN